MDKKEFPRLLILTVNSWSEMTASGNTIMNHFGFWDPNKISNIFLRNEPIDNSFCKNYFRLSEKDIIHSLITNNQIGVQIQLPSNVTFDTVNNLKKTHKILRILIELRPYFILLLRELFWKVGFLKRKELNSFLQENKPEIIHFHIASLIYPNRLLYYLYKKTNAKVILFWGDELYSYKSFWPLSFIFHNILRYSIRNLVKISNLNYAATQELSEYYSKVFKKEFIPLFKGIEKSSFKTKNPNLPLKIVYAGNLLYGRWKTLIIIINAIRDAGFKENEISLDIYSSTPIISKITKYLTTNYSNVLNALPFEEIKKVMDKTDIVLHVESFEKKHIKFTKFSFSTKIVDCIQSNACILGVGPQEISSIKFLDQSKASLVAKSYEELIEIFRNIKNNPKIIPEYARKMHDFSNVVFHLEKIRNNIYNDINRVLT